VAPPPERDNPVTAVARENATRSKEALDKLRQRADTTAKAFGALATSLLTAVGVAKIGDVFPLESSNRAWTWAGALFVGFGLMAAAIAFFTARLWRVSNPILAHVDPDRMKDYLSKSELALVKEVYKEARQRWSVPSVRAYARRGRRLERIADRLNHEPSAAKLRERSAAIGVELQAVMSHALALVGRRRAGKVVRSWLSVGAFAVFVIGVVVFAVSSDRLESARAGEIALAKSCAEARTAHATEDALPGLCGDEKNPTPEQIVALAKACADARTANAAEETITAVCGEPSTPDDEAKTTPDQEADSALVALVQARGRCRAAVREAGAAQPGPCAALDRAVAAALREP
jgi:hypothetical protein